MRNILLLSLLIATNLAYSQLRTLEQAQASEFVQSDTLFKPYIQLWVDHIAKLNKEILPKYHQLKLDIGELILEEDRSQIEYVFNTYFKRLDDVESEMRNTQRRQYHNLMVYSRVNNALTMEWMRSYPDSYAFLLNMTHLKQIADPADRSILEGLYRTYKPLMAPLENRILAFQTEINEHNNSYEATYFGGKQSTSEEDRELANLIDLLIWALM